jgi:hypothetical protein
VDLVVRCLSCAVSRDIDFPRVTAGSYFCSSQLFQRSTFHLFLHPVQVQTGENGHYLLRLITVIIIIIIVIIIIIIIIIIKLQPFLPAFQRVGCH